MINKIPDNFYLKLQQGDRRAFDYVYKLYYPRLMAYACRFVSQKEAEDVVQDTFLYVWRKHNEIEFGENFFYYLMRSVHNGSLNIITRNMRNSELDPDYRLQLLKAHYYEEELDEISQKLLDKEIRQAINEAVNTLPQRCKEIFRLSYFNDLKSKEIAIVFNISIRTVDAQLYKALKLLRERLRYIYEETK